MVLVDPTSTARSIATEASSRGVSTMALWSTCAPLRDQIYSAEIVARASIEETADAVRLAADAASITVLPGSDDGVPLADSVSRHLLVPIASGCRGLCNGHRQSKHEQHHALSSAGMRACRGVTGFDWNESMEELCATSRSVVVKLDEGTGSEGVRLCKSAAEARAHFEWLMRHQRRSGGERRAAIVQEFLEGREFVVDTVSRQGVHKVVMIWRYDKRRVADYEFIYFGETPLAADVVEARVLMQYVREALTAVGVQTGPCHTEVILLAAEDDAPCLVEVNLRCHGGSGVWVPLAERLVGYSQVSVAVDACVAPHRFDALPHEPPSPLAGGGAFLCLVSYARGRVVATPGYEHLRTLPSFISLNPMGVAIGSDVEVTSDLATLIGMVVLSHASEAVVAADVATVRELEAHGRLVELARDYDTKSTLGAVRRRKVGFG